jgi:hypothetical protein
MRVDTNSHFKVVPDMTRKSEGWAIALERIGKESSERTGSLDLGMLGLTELPSELFDLTHLRELNLGRGWNESGRRRLASAEIGRNEISASLYRARTSRVLRCYPSCQRYRFSIVQIPKSTTSCPSRAGRRYNRYIAQKPRSGTLEEQVDRRAQDGCAASTLMPVFLFELLS